MLFTDQSFYTVGNGRRFVVLPSLYDVPPRVYQRTPELFVAFAITSDLRPPIIGV